MKTPPENEGQLIDTDVERLIKKYGYDNVQEAVRKAGHGSGRPKTFSPIRKLHAWAQIEAIRLRNKCSVKKASEILSLSGGLMKPTSIGSGGLGDFVTPVRRTLKVPSGTQHVTEPATLRNYHQDGETILKSLDAATAEAWRDFAQTIARQVGI